MPETRPPPAFTGLSVHRDPTFRYSTFVAHDWQRIDLEEGGAKGAMYLPNPEDEHTFFALEARQLDIKVRKKDLAALRGGFFEGLENMPDSAVESKEAEAVGELITMEAQHTFRDEAGALRKRWVRLLYQGRTQVRIVAQGSSPEEFAHWQAMFAYSIRTFKFGDWWADMIGVEWAEKPFPDDA